LRLRSDADRRSVPSWQRWCESRALEWVSFTGARLRKHGIAFDEAMTSFADPLSVLLPDPDHSLDEQRYLVLGMSNRRRLLVIAFVERFSRTRLISARRATRRERCHYEEKA
jgi:uncharacterized protein